MLKSLCLVLGLAAGSAAAEFPQAEIANGSVRARLYLPDTQQGYYRATRFDWSGIIAGLEYKGHSYFGQWFERYDPKLHDSITGPVESFSVIGYDEVKPGETFLRIGVGVLRKPEERALSDFTTYEIMDPGKWTVSPAGDSVEFVQELGDTYVYRKTVRLAKDKPELVLEHSLKNTGKRTLETDVFDHDFFMLDNQPTGPDFVVKFPFEVRAVRDLRGMAETRGKEFVYLKELQQGQSVSSNLQGFGSTAADYDIRVENQKTGAGVRQTSDRPISRLVFWSIRTTVCPEAYIHLKVEPGQETSWRIAYEFYTR